ncbi:MAG: glucose 1-dehydrogenase [Chloroflexi bacterium]|nr:glucose 1-dehydrogenase [Chloroflexota bacterium]
MRYQGKVAIVTGGGHGIGAAYCRGFAREGARVVVADIDGPAAEQVAADLAREGAQALGVRTDVATLESAREMARRAHEQYGRIDVLVNNAAIFATIPINRAGFEEIDDAEWDRVMAVNVKGIWYCCRAVAPYMRQQQSGSIINIASGTALYGPAGRIHYVASKGAVLAFTRTLARELGGANIRVNSLTPGSTLSEANPTEEILRMRAAATGDRAIKRVQRPDDLVGACLFLGSDDAAFMTGQTLVADGGQNMH